MHTLPIDKSLLVTLTTQDWNSKLKDDRIARNNAIEKMTEKGKQFEGNRSFCSTEIAELKAEIAILLVKEENGIRSEISTSDGKQEITDTSSSYNPSDGIFTVPVSGVYVFTWSASCDEGRWQDTELVVDNTPYRSLSVDSNEENTLGVQHKPSFGRFVN
ncbi:unnamed protein product [Mytilus edulis]|uniref:C1q domain-containing protein n=1 Tax=Mytilus edulis TaxID=6550 RepID=A0A8S3UPS6_MYTED|nr:unnamed protein product [Mytilus edulis]